MEVLVEMVRPTLILHDPSYAKGFVRQVNVGHGSTLIPFDHVVLSGTGTPITELLSQLSPAAELHITQEVTTYAEDCQTPLTQSWTKAYAGIGGGFYFLKNGEVRSFDDNPGATYRNPRTAIAYNNDYIFFIVVDGRDTKHSIGMSIEELGIFARDTL